MTRSEFAKSVISRAAAWSRREAEEAEGGIARPLKLDHVEIMLVLASRKDVTATPSSLRRVGEKNIAKVKPTLEALQKRGYLHKGNNLYTLTDKGITFVNTILR